MDHARERCTVGGLSSSSPTFTGSLNFDQTQEGEAPSIDFAGAGRTVPWATWYESTPGINFASDNIFASRFDNTGDANQGKWIFAGQGRGTGGGSIEVPSLNIHTDQSAENPSVASGSAVDPTKPGPWVTWQETTTFPVDGKDQIFVVRPIGPGAANWDGVTPAGDSSSGNVPAIGGFCWQQVGIGRVGPGTADPSLNVDPTRDGIEPDIAFTGPSDSVPWVVWYETGPSGVGLQTNELVFAAKAVSDGVSANGGFHRVAVGSQGTATLDQTGAHGFGGCAASSTAEQQCSLNKNPAADAEDPQVAAGTMTAGQPTVPWVTWDENVSGVEQVFVSRLVGTGAAARFQIVNGGRPISSGAGAGATRPDITFSGNTPYVTWRQAVGAATRGFVGHFVKAANPTFVLDANNVPLTPTTQADVREPISSSCTANPFNLDGAACQGRAPATPFFLFTNGTNPRSLFGDAITAPPPPPPKPSFNSTAKLLSRGRKVLAGGNAPVCSKAQKIIIGVTITQGSRKATGTSSSHTCTCAVQRWAATLTVLGGSRQRMHAGTATGSATARITTLAGKPVTTVRWSATLTLG